MWMKKDKKSMRICLGLSLLFINIVWIILKANVPWIGMFPMAFLECIKNLQIYSLRLVSFSKITHSESDRFYKNVKKLQKINNLS